MIYVIDEHAKTTSKRAKVIAVEGEEQSHSQRTILKAISNIVGQHGLKVTSRLTSQLSNELGGQHPMNF